MKRENKVKSTINDLDTLLLPLFLLLLLAMPGSVPTLLPTAHTTT